MPIQNHPARAVVVALLCSVLAFVGRRALDPVLGSALGYAFALGGVALSLYLAGWKATTVNVFASAAWVNYFYFLPNRVTFALLDISLLSALLSYLVICAMLLYFARQAAEAVAQTERATAALRAADRQKDEFISVLSHELRNPLGAIANAALVIREQTGGDDPRRAAALLHRQVQQMSRLLDDLLDVARISRGLVELDRRRQDVRTCVRDAIDANAHLVATAEQALHVDMPDRPVVCLVDGPRITQIVSNLINNATKYAGGSARIEVRVRGDAQAVTIVVRDDGRGLDQKLIPQLFDRFRAVPANRGLQGLGLGLWISQRLAAMHGGKITAASGGPGTGAQFTLAIPACAEPGKRRHAARRATACEPPAGADAALRTRAPCPPTGSRR